MPPKYFFQDNQREKMMGWWESFNSVKTWGSNVWNKTTTAGLAVWKNPSLNYVVKGVTYLGYKTVAGVFDQIAAIPKVGYTVFTNSSTQWVAGNLVRIIVQDIAPYVLVGFVNDWIHSYTREHLEEGDDRWFSPDMVLEVGLLLLNMGTMTYMMRRKLQEVVRTTVLSLDAPTALTEGNNQHLVCGKDNKDCKKRFLEGTVRNAITYNTEQFFLDCLKFLPWVGDKMPKLIAPSLSAYSHGRYVLRSVTDGLCSKHQDEYLFEYRETSYSVGLVHYLLSLLINEGLEWGTGIPKSYYETSIKNLLLIVQISIASHMHLPPLPKEESKRSIFTDPLTLYTKFVTFILKYQHPLFVDFFRIVIHYFKGEEPTINWWQQYQKGKKLWVDPKMVRIRQLALPPMLGSFADFQQDPVVAARWNNLRSILIKSVDGIEEAHKSLILRFAAKTPGVKAVVAWYLGIPEFSIKFAVKIIKNKTLIGELVALRTFLYTRHSGPAPFVEFKSNLTPLNQEVLPNEENPQNEDDAPIPNIEEVIEELDKEPQAQGVVKIKRLADGEGSSSMAGDEQGSKTTSVLVANSIFQPRNVFQRRAANEANSEDPNWVYLEKS